MSPGRVPRRLVRVVEILEATRFTSWRLSSLEPWLCEAWKGTWNACEGTGNPVSHRTQVADYRFWYLSCVRPRTVLGRPMREMEPLEANGISSWKFSSLVTWVCEAYKCTKKACEDVELLKGTILLFEGCGDW